MTNSSRRRAALLVIAGLGALAASFVGLRASAEKQPAKLSLVEKDRGTALERMPPPLRRADPPAHAGNHGSTLVADTHGLLVVERSAGELVRADPMGRRVAALKIAESPTPSGAGLSLGEVVHDGAGKVFVADRAGDRVVRVAPGDAEGSGLEIRASAELREPFGLALTPGGQTLLVTSVAEHELVALDADDLELRWRVELAPEPRGVAVSPDGTRAAVGFLSSSSVALVHLPSWGQRVDWRSLDPSDRIVIDKVQAHLEGKAAYYYAASGEEIPMVDAVFVREARSRHRVPVEVGRRYARNAWALAFLSGKSLAVAHQLATPQLQRVPRADRSDIYGGGIDEARPMSTRLALLGQLDAPVASARTLSVDLRQPRALAYDSIRDRLYVAGYGDDRLVAIADAHTQMPWVDWSVELEQGCGADGVALGMDPSRDEDRPIVWVHCEFTRQLRGLDLGDPDDPGDDAWILGDALAPQTRSDPVERGAELFRRADVRVSAEATLACASCHPEGRSDGLTWRLGDSILQAPILAGRVGGTGPYKWDGQDPDLRASLRHTIERLGGRPEEIRDEELDAIIAYIESLPPPRPKTPENPQAVARGREVFEEAACDACHLGPQLTDAQQHELDTTLDHVDTPSLLGLGHSAPYYHDGSAIDLRTLVSDRGSVHEMADTSALPDKQLRDLVAYLESL